MFFGNYLDVNKGMAWPVWIIVTLCGALAFSLGWLVGGEGDIISDVVRDRGRRRTRNHSYAEKRRRRACQSSRAERWEVWWRTDMQKESRPRKKRAVRQIHAAIFVEGFRFLPSEDACFLPFLTTWKPGCSASWCWASSCGSRSSAILRTVSEEGRCSHSRSCSPAVSLVGVSWFWPSPSRSRRMSCLRVSTAEEKEKADIDQKRRFEFETLRPVWSRGWGFPLTVLQSGVWHASWCCLRLLCGQVGRQLDVVGGTALHGLWLVGDGVVWRFKQQKKKKTKQNCQKRSCHLEKT